MKMRSIITPLAVGAFLAIGLTGIALFFHIQNSLVHEAHEWIGLFFVATALWHAKNNWHSLLNYARRRASIIAFVLVLAAAGILIGATGQKDDGGGGPRPVIEALARQPIENVATAFGLSKDQALAALSAKGIIVNDQELLADAARDAQKSPLFVLSVLSQKPQ